MADLSQHWPKADAGIQAMWMNATNYNEGSKEEDDDLDSIEMMMSLNDKKVSPLNSIGYWKYASHKEQQVRYLN